MGNRPTVQVGYFMTKENRAKVVKHVSSQSIPGI